MVDQYSEEALVFWGIFLLVEAVALICFIVWGFCIAIGRITDWVNTDYPKDEEEDE